MNQAGVTNFCVSNGVIILSGRDSEHVYARFVGLSGNRFHLRHCHRHQQDPPPPIDVDHERRVACHRTLFRCFLPFGGYVRICRGMTKNAMPGIVMHVPTP